jgi:stearoyl-CoA desaturase (delta-9 desaturase)
MISRHGDRAFKSSPCAACCFFRPYDRIKETPDAQRRHHLPSYHQVINPALDVEPAGARPATPQLDRRAKLMTTIMPTRKELRSTPLIDQQPWTRPWWQPSEGNGPVLFYLLTIHALALTGLILFPVPGWRVLAACLAICAVGGIGTSVCYHRCLAHRALRLHRAVESVLIFFTIFNGSGGPLTWVANHRHHHAKADTPEDVSSPRYGGFWWAHLRWVYQWSGSEARRWCPDLDQRRFHLWRRLQIPILILALGSGSVLGWEGFFWVGAIRLVYALHLQMFVNSLLHLRPGLPEGADSSRNLWWLGPLQLGAWGENWHRNHHGEAQAARFGRRWWQIDLGWYVICGLQWLGLASQVRRPKAERQKLAGRAR